jgi:hypothetical protein
MSHQSNPAVTQDRWCVLAFGPRLDRKASNAWAMSIPTLKTMKNAAITSNIDGPCAIVALTKRSIFCTVKKISVEARNFPPRDDFEQHCGPNSARAEGEGETMSVRRRCFPFEGNFMPVRDPEPSRQPSSPRPSSQPPSRPTELSRQPEPNSQYPTSGK